MKEFDYVIIGGGCAGLSLAYELEINNKLKDKTLAIIETREEYKRDKMNRRDSRSTTRSQQDLNNRDMLWYVLFMLLYLLY